MYIPPPTLPVELGALKINIVEILFCTKTAKYIQFRAQHFLKYASNRKKLQIIFQQYQCFEPPSFTLGGE